MRWIERHQTWIGFAFAFAAGVLAAAFWMYREAKAFWDIATALGTIAAAVVALGIASFQWSRDRAFANTSGVVAAALMRDRTTSMMNKSRNFGFVLRGYAAHPLNGPVPIALLTESLDELQLLIPWSHQELVVLTGVRGNLAYKMVRAVGAYNEAISTTYNSWHAFVIAPVDMRARLAAEYAGMFLKAGSHFREALDAVDAVVAEMER